MVECEEGSTSQDDDARCGDDLVSVHVIDFPIARVAVNQVLGLHAEPVVRGTVEAMSHVLHVDADSFFASVEQALRPELSGRAVVVGHRDGMVLAASWPAKTAGVKTTMPVVQARRLVRDLEVISSRFEAYQAASTALHAILGRCGGVVESASIDEAFIDLTTIAHDASCTDHLDETDEAACHAVRVATAIREQVFTELGLTVSVGTGPNKLVAKLASRKAKPDGQFHVSDAEAAGFVLSHTLSGIWGIGPATIARLTELGITTTAELAAADRSVIARRLGPAAGRLVDLACGLDDRPIQADTGPAQSISVERSSRDTAVDTRSLNNRFSDLLGDAIDRLDRSGLSTQRIDVRVVEGENERHAGRRLPAPTRDAGVITSEALELWRTGGYDLVLADLVRRMTVSFSALSEFEQLALLPSAVSDVPRDRSVPTLTEVAYRGMVLKHPRFGTGVLVTMGPEGLLVRFGETSRLFDSSTAFTY